MAALARGASRGGSRLTRGGWAGVCEVCCQCHWRWVSVGACAVRGPLGAHEHVVAVRRGPGHAVRCGEHQGCGGRGSFDVSRRARRCAWRRCAASWASSAARGGADVGAPCHPSRDRVILLSILTYTFCVRLVCRTPAAASRASSLDRLPRRARTRGPPGPRRSAGSRIADWVRAGGGSSRGAWTRSGAGFDSRRVRALSRPGYARG